MAALLTRHGLPPLWGRRPGFATLVWIILGQQVSIAAARTMYLRLCDRLGGVTPERIAAAGVAGLRAEGITRQKSAYCCGLAARLLDRRLDLAAVSRAGDAEARAMLQAVPGLGPWSVDIYLLMALRRPDVWPAGDLALAEALRRTRRLRARPDLARQQRIAAAWAPWRSVAARLLWQYYLATDGRGNSRR